MNECLGQQFTLSEKRPSVRLLTFGVSSIVMGFKEFVIRKRNGKTALLRTALFFQTKSVRMFSQLRTKFN